MTRIVLVVFSFLIFSLAPLVGFQDTLTMHDVSKVMDRFFVLHISHKEFNPTIVRRCFKIYIENFDYDKSYLLESEVKPYLEMTDSKAQEIIKRLDKGDFSDFVLLNQLVQKSIIRAQSQRKDLITSLVTGKESFDSQEIGSMSGFAKNLNQLQQRQKARMVRFFSYHNLRTALDTLDRKEKVFLLFERKIRRFEFNYLFITTDGSTMHSDKIEHLMAVRILKSFAKSLDTHTSFFSPEEAYEMRLGLEKQFEGVGVILSEGIDGIMIAELIDGSPAQKSGKIHVNDYLVEIDKQPVQSYTFEEVMDLLKKKGKEEINLGFKRNVSTNNESYYHVKLKKQPIVIANDRLAAEYQEYDNGIIGKIALHSFYENGEGASSEKDIKEAIRSFRSKGNLIGLVLDLRENSGGFLSQAVKVAGLFVSNGVIVISKYGKDDLHYLRNVSGRSFYNGPLVILTSKMSASAAEIVAQALQDYGVGVVVGDQTTFGKGSIQYQTVTDPSADLFFKVTVGRYYTVSGKSTQVTGVIADIVVPSSYAPYNIGERYLEYPLTPDHVESAYTDSLKDLDDRTKKIFQMRYMPFLQRAVTFWKKHLPELKSKSADRLNKSSEFQNFLQKQEIVHARAKTLAPNSVDERVDHNMNDLQMQEAVHIVKDMIQIQTVADESLNDLKAEYLPTGS